MLYDERQTGKGPNQVCEMLTHVPCGLSDRREGDADGQQSRNCSELDQVLERVDSA